MRQSGLIGMGQQGDRINVSLRNRTRLMLQNRKLLAEVYKLEQLITSVIERSAAEQWTGIEESQEIAQKYRSETDQQQRMITRLKKEIKTVKATLADHKYIQIKNEENQVTFLRRECDRLMQEKETLAQQKREKEGALEYHQPINQQTASTLQLYKKTKAANGQLKAKIHQLQREVAKYHHMKEMAKSFVPKQYDNPDYQFMKIDNDIATMRKEMKRIEEKWRAKVEAIDKEYFSFKDIRQRKVLQVQAMEKEAKNYENHVSAMRDQMAVASDRERINGVVISPQKRREMQELIQDEKRRLKRLSPKAPQNKQRTNSKTFDKNKPKKTQNELKLIPQSKQETNSEKLPQEGAAEYEITQYSEKKKVETTVQVDVGKGRKMVESVGVGTTFYYADD